MPQSDPGISNIGPWIISAVALIQVWLIALYKRFRKAKISIYESGNIEIGFSDFGPTIGLFGTLTVDTKDTFIKNINLKLTKQKDNASHSFTWKAFRANTISVLSDQPTSLELASSFLLRKDNPHKYHIVFVEESYLSDMNPKVAQIPKKWFDYKKEKYESLKEEEKAIISKENVNMVEQLLYDEFIKSGRTTPEYTELDRSFYWEACDYKLEFIIETPKIKTRYSKIFYFSLNQEEITQLRLNVVGIIRALCGFTQHWYFSYNKYGEKKV